MKIRMLILSAAATASALASIAAPVMAQPYGPGPDRPGYDHGQPAYDQGRPGADRGQDDRGQPGPNADRDRFRDDLREREQKLQDWMQRGQTEGWLRGWQARRALGTLANIRREDHAMRWRNGGFLRPDQRFQLNQQMDSLTQFIRSLHDNGGYRR
jgi:hypothetical protein